MTRYERIERIAVWVVAIVLCIAVWAGLCRLVHAIVGGTCA